VTLQMDGLFADLLACEESLDASLDTALEAPHQRVLILIFSAVMR
jgi:hypothetical protein